MNFNIDKTVNINKDEIIETRAIEHDTKTRFITFKFLGRNAPVDLSSCKVRVYAINSIYNEVFNDLVILDPKKGIAELELTDSMLKPGITEYQIKIMLNSGGQLSSNTMRLIVEKDLMSDNSLEGSNEYKAFENALSKIDNLDDLYFQKSKDVSIADGKKVITANNYGVMGRTKGGIPDYMVFIGTDDRIKIGYSGRAIDIISNDVNINGMRMGAKVGNDFKNCIPIIGSDRLMEVGRFIDFHIDGEDKDYHTRLECTGANSLNTSGHFNAKGYITSIGDDNNAILGTGPKDIFICNNKSQKYLQLKNDGGLCYSDRKIQLEPQAAPLWRGYHHMVEDEIITPTKKLSECTNGWILVWSDFNAGGTGEDYNFCLSYIPKNTPWKGGQGYNFCTPSDMGEDSYTAKYIYVFDDHISGHKDNRTGKREDVVIRAILEY
ncbi:MAG: BppU family phage baseplate upper protein [Clostridium sp.]|uniref:BppU family phage baseplate upper protein n=1 Tax=Clostridium sp. TaxID=1506 RepID=UPI003F304B67